MYVYMNACIFAFLASLFCVLTHPHSPTAGQSGRGGGAAAAGGWRGLCCDPCSDASDAAAGWKDDGIMGVEHGQESAREGQMRVSGRKSSLHDDFGGGGGCGRH